MNQQFYSIAYDIPDDKRRRKLAKILESYGQRVQYSVFEMELPPALIQKLRQEMTPFCLPDTDQLRIYTLCKQCLKKTEVIGKQPLCLDPDYYWV